MSDYRAKIRMYRHGLGDCHLVRLKREGQDDYTILVDCGVILGTSNAKAQIAKVMADIQKETGGRIDLLVVTHAHGDHVSGFIQAEAEFRALTIGKVWMAWTEDPDDEFAKSLLSERNKAKDVLEAAENRMRFAGAGEEADELAGIMGFFNAGKGPRTTEDAVQVARELAKDGKPPVYCRPGDAPYRPEGVAARLMVLGPPRDEALIRKSTPSGRNPETYEAAGYPMFMNQLGPLAPESAGGPFSSLEEIPFDTAKTLPFFRGHYWTGSAADDDWRRIDDVWLGSAVDLALKLDSDTNNTSLVFAIELDGESVSGQPGRDVLLFAADAQVGNWLSWANVAWEAPEGEDPVGGLDLVRRTIVYKVGHHGSHNATLRTSLESMERLLVALNPVDEVMAQKKRWDHIPLPSLEAALKKQAKEGLVRADQPPPASARITDDPLFYEVAI